MNQQLLRVLSDDFTPVRDISGRLLGVIPRIADNAEIVFGTNGTAYELRVAAQVCVCVNSEDPTQHPSHIDGFIAVDNATLMPQQSTLPPGEDPDLAKPV
jgi:hypothetical protein